MRLITALIFSVVFAVGAACAEVPPVNVKPALNHAVTSVKVGSRPYEMEGRKEERLPLVDFESLVGWTVELHDGVEADFVRTREQQLWGSYVAKLAYKGASPAGWVIVRPPKPIPIPDSSDCINLWIYGNNWGWAVDPKHPQTVVSILISDSQGNDKTIELTRVRWEEWWLAHKKLPEDLVGASFTGLRVSEMTNAEENALFFDSLSFYKQQLKPLKFDPRPKRNLTAFPGQDQGLNTGPGTLPFPTREKTIMPTNFAKGFTNSVVENPKGTWTFAYSGTDAKVEYAYTPKTGSLGDVTAYINGAKSSVPMSGGGMELDGKVSDGKMIGATVKDNVLRTTWDFGKTRVEYAFRIWQKSLVMDFICRGGDATGLSFGEVHDIEHPKLVMIPFLTLGASPKVLCTGTPDKPTFTTIWADWYRSSGSELWSGDWAQARSAKINGGVRYIPRTDGKRNDLYERIFLTVSPTFEETLPTIPNPPSPLGKIAGERLWQESWGPENHAKEHERSKVLRSYGIDKLTQCNHEVAWRDGGESFTVRTKAAPRKGGDEALKKYVADQKSLGWLSGLYTNYCDYAPVNEKWDEDKVQFTPEGEWRPGWPRCYALKPSRAVEFDAELAPVIQKKFGSNAAYTDVHTAVPPWMYCDYDSRVPGAGTFAATFYAYGELLLSDQKTYGPTWSEGTYHWLYAGLATGNYGLAYSQADMSKEPLNVAFDLMMIHPLECDIGMPWTGGFFKSGGDWQSDPQHPEQGRRIEQSIDHFIAATIAYGHIGWLVEEVHGIQRTCRSYYMLQQLQNRYAMRKPAKIEYADNREGEAPAEPGLSSREGEVSRREGEAPAEPQSSRWLTVSQAIATDAIKHSRLHVVYDNGLEIYVNGSRDFWTLPNKMILPSWGWYATDKKGGFVEYSALVDGHRADYVKSADYEYLDGRGIPTAHNGLAAKGSVAVRRKGKSIEVIDIFGNDEIGVAVKGPATCEAFDPNGKSLGPVELRAAQVDMAWFKPKKDARSYMIKPSQSGATALELSISLPKDYVVPGESLKAEITYTAHQPVQLQSVSVSVEGQPAPAIAGHGSQALKAGQIVRVAVPFDFPKSIAIGDSVWVKATAKTASGEQAEAWYVLRAKPAFEIALNEVDPGVFEVEARTNILAFPKPEMSASLSPESGPFVLQQKLTKGKTIYSISSPGGPAGATGKLTIKAAWQDFETTREFPIRVVEEHPLVHPILGSEGFAWGYAYRGKQEQAVNVVGASHETGAITRVEDLPCGGVIKRSIFMHPPWVNGAGYTYCTTGPITIPDKDCEFRGFIGIRDGGSDSDGVSFILSVLDNSSEHRIMEESWKERRWKPVSADLSAFKGKTIRLRFVADVGPKDNPTADWAAWGEPEIVEKSPNIRVKLAE